MPDEDMDLLEEDCPEFDDGTDLCNMMDEELERMEAEQDDRDIEESRALWEQQEWDKIDEELYAEAEKMEDENG